MCASELSVPVKAKAVFVGKEVATSGIQVKQQQAACFIETLYPPGDLQGGKRAGKGHC